MFDFTQKIVEDISIRLELQQQDLDALQYEIDNFQVSYEEVEDEFHDYLKHLPLQINGKTLNTIFIADLLQDYDMHTYTELKKQFRDNYDVTTIKEYKALLMERENILNHLKGK